MSHHSHVLNLFTIKTVFEYLKTEERGKEYGHAQPNLEANCGTQFR